MSQGKHSPTRLRRYQETHSTIIQQFIRGGFVVSDELVFEAFGNAIFLEGTLRCLGSLYLDVRKRLEIFEEENIPTLGEAITELRDWYYAHLEELSAL